MIQLHNVTKIYFDKHKKQTKALNGVSFTLPDKGFVFVVGKSGCGKSTLLNMMGGCDKITEGEITVDGNRFSQFGVHDFDDYRNDYVGFVFQDYCLLEKLTVRQNVELALQLGGIDDPQAADDALAQVDLADLADRYPDELSGGQKQRVAIARTLVKKTKMILADEPTGNLDAASSRIVLQLLQQISQQTLVVIVSHNKWDAEEFADRIIELSDGCVNGDYTRNPNAQEVTFGEDIVIQKGARFTDEQLREINDYRNRGALIKQVETRFLPTQPLKTQPQHKPLNSHRFHSKGKRTLFWMFAKKRTLSMVLTVITVAFVIAVLGVCQFFTQFSADAEIARIVSQSENGKTFALQKARVASEINTTPLTDTLVDVTQSDIEAFRATGYTGNIYPLYNVSLMTHTRGGNIVWDVEAYSMPTDEKNYANFYCGSGLGVLVTDEQFLAKIYGDEQGEIKVLSGSLQTEGDKVLLTDYIADSILTYEPTYAAEGEDKYARLTNGALHLGRFRVAGVIYTGYAERYADIIQKVKEGTFSAKKDPDRYATLLQELNSTLNIGYSFNPDFYQAYATDEECPRSVYYGTMELRLGEHVTISNSYSYRDDSLLPNEIRLAKSVYARLMGIDVSQIDESQAIGSQITLDRYKFVRGEGDLPDYSLEVTVASLLEDINGVGGFNCSPEIYRKLKEFGNAPYALYFDDLSNVTELYDVGTELTYVVKNPLVSALYTVAKSTLVFTEVFEFIGIVLLVIAVATLAGFGVGCVHKNMYEIAVVRSLGGRTRDLVAMFLLQMLMIGLIVSVLSVAAMAVGANVCNNMLADGYTKLANNVFMRQLNVITFRWQTALADAFATLVLTAFAATLPMLIMRRAKPREIIKAKE